MDILAKKVIKKLSKKKLTISVAESCTGGLLSFSLAGISGASKVYSFGMTLYSNESKNNFLNISKISLKKYGAVSYETCLSMVKNLNKITNTSISISITGIAGPKGRKKKKPVGLVFIGLKKGNKTFVEKQLFKNKGRLNIQKAAVTKTLKLILSFLK